MRDLKGQLADYFDRVIEHPEAEEVYEPGLVTRPRGLSCPTSVGNAPRFGLLGWLPRRPHFW